MARRKQATVRIVYRGRADTHIIPGPSGAVYTFERGTPTEVSAEDATFFLEQSGWAPVFSEFGPVEPAAPEPESPVVEYTRRAQSVEVAPEIEVAEPASGTPEGAAEE